MENLLKKWIGNYFIVDLVSFLRWRGNKIGQKILDLLEKIKNTPVGSAGVLIYEKRII